jgi:hypothetical protein
MTPAIQSEFSPWSTSYPVTFALFLAACAYFRGWLRLRSTSPNLILPWQLAAFMSGMFALWVALGSPLRTLHHELLSIHMVDHVLLMAVAPPLILLGAPLRSFVHALPQRFVRAASAGFLSWSPMQKLGRRLGHVLGHPLFCWLAAVIALIGWHVPAAFELAMRSNSWDEFEYACFSELDCSSGGRLSDRGQTWLAGCAGPLFFTFFLPPFRVTCFRRFLRFATALCIRVTCPGISILVFQLFKTRSMRAR